MQILEAEWDETSRSIYLCELPFSVNEVESILGCSFFDYDEMGLGQCFGAYIKINEHKYFLMGATTRSNRDPGVVVMIRSFDNDPALHLHAIGSAFGINIENFKWINNEIK